MDGATQANGHIKYIESSTRYELLYDMYHGMFPLH